MHRAAIRWAPALLGLLSSLAAADDPCSRFKWDVTRERALFEQTPQVIRGAGDGTAAADLLPERLYELSLVAQTEMKLSVPLGKKSDFPAAFGGFARLHIPEAGPYRIALDQSGWIDILGAQGVITSNDFAGGTGCSAPGKLVQFALPAGTVMLQLTGIKSSHIRLTLTRSPP